MSLMTPLPIYVTRKNGDGEIASYSLTAWMPLVAILIIWANIMAWGIYGIVVLVEKIS